MKRTSPIRDQTQQGEVEETPLNKKQKTVSSSPPPRICVDLTQDILESPIAKSVNQSKENPHYCVCRLCKIDRKHTMEEDGGLCFICGKYVDFDYYQFADPKDCEECMREFDGIKKESSGKSVKDEDSSSGSGSSSSSSSVDSSISDSSDSIMRCQCDYCENHHESTIDDDGNCTSCGNFYDPDYCVFPDPKDCEGCVAQREKEPCCECSLCSVHRDYGFDDKGDCAFCGLIVEEDVEYGLVDSVDSEDCEECARDKKAEKENGKEEVTLP